MRIPQIQLSHILACLLRENIAIAYFLTPELSGGFDYRIKQMEMSRFFFLESYSNKLQTTSSFIPEVEMRF